MAAYSGAVYPTAAAYRVMAPESWSYEASPPTRKPSRDATASAVKVGPFESEITGWRRKVGPDGGVMIVDEVEMGGGR